MPHEHWKINDLPWDQFDPSRIDPETIKLVKAAAMVEYGGSKYGEYLCQVFHDDPDFQQAARAWAQEEVQHGDTLGRYATIADPTFDFQHANARYNAGYKIDTAAMMARRGSPAGELVARCIVEIGTSSYYTALGDATKEPLLKAICHNIATDEFHHYNMFYTHLLRYLARDNISRWQRLKTGLGRVLEVDDDELACAYFAANTPETTAYKREDNARAYMARAYPLYTRRIVEHSVALLFKACGFKPYSRWQDLATRATWIFLRHITKRAVMAEAAPTNNQS